MSYSDRGVLKLVGPYNRETQQRSRFSMNRELFVGQSKSSVKPISVSISHSADYVARSLGSLPGLVDFPGSVIDPIIQEDGTTSLNTERIITTEQVETQIRCAILAVVCFLPLGYVALHQARKARRALLSGKSTDAEYYIQSSSELTALSICIGVVIVVMGIFLLYWNLRRPAEIAMPAMQNTTAH
nr:hypothetical protein BgiMline_007890 [Biomphalaria glabrata]